MADQDGHRDPATPEEIWNILREAAEIRKETDQVLKRLGQETDRRTQETDRRTQETDRRTQETDRRMQETDRRMQATDRQMQETDLRLRKLDELFNGQWGKLMESLVEGDLVKLLNQRGIAVDHTMTNAKKNYGERRWEFDILAVNGEEVVVVEVKTTLKVADVDYFVERLQDFPELMPEFADRRTYGALAYLKTDGFRGRPCRAPGTVRNPGYRQQREHHQRRGFRTARLRSAPFGSPQHAPLVIYGGPSSPSAPLN